MQGRVFPAESEVPPTWPSPWPYDFPVDGTVRTPPDKVARAQGLESAPPEFTRRRLFHLSLLGWAALTMGGGTAVLEAARMMFPNVVFEPPMRFPTAPPATFAPGTVDTTWKESNAVWIVHVDDRIIALSTVCTHLGCTPDWLQSEHKFKCPCHGSGYYITGVNFEGPAPRPLERYRVYVDPADGNLWVDKTSKCRVELGTCEGEQFFVRAA